MEGVFAERVTLQELILARLEAELFKLAPRKPLTLECDEIKITYSVCENVLIFEVSYDLRANGRRARRLGGYRARTSSSTLSVVRSRFRLMSTD